MKKLSYLFLGLAALTLATACDDTDSYADLLNAETKYVNAYLADQRVVNDIPADTIFEVGPNAPYYRLEPEGNIYMQVLDAGTAGDKVEYNEQVYFRYMRYSLAEYADGELPDGYGNAEDMAASPTSFRFQNLQLPSTTQLGTAIQLPLYYLPFDCHVNLVVKSQYGPSDEISYVVPYLYNIRYYRPRN